MELLDFSGEINDRSQAEMNPYRCGTCSRATNDLKTCSACRLISFCSQSCQKLFWKKHQQLCRVASKMITTGGKRTVFEVESDRNLEGAHKLANSCLMLILKLPSLLKRDLGFEERLVSLVTFKMV